MSENSERQLPKQLERYLGSLATKYGNDGNKTLQSIIVNSSYSIQEDYSYDEEWNGWWYGHALHFKVPEKLFHEIMDNIDSLSKKIAQDLKLLCRVPNEYIEEVFLEIKDVTEIVDWREQSDVFSNKDSMLTKATIDDQKRLWDKGKLHVFLSHKNEYKKKTAKLKEELRQYGVASFVAHEDIKPTKEWQKEIERALLSMHVMVPLLTDEFNKSNWTDQEVGVAIGRKVPIVPIRLGKDPYGFIYKYQAMQGNGKDMKQLAKELFELFLKSNELKELAKEAFIMAIDIAESFNIANELAEFLPMINVLSNDQIERLLGAYNGNYQAREAYKLNYSSTRSLSEKKSLVKSEFMIECLHYG